jgi:hypothetical protein
MNGVFIGQCAKIMRIHFYMTVTLLVLTLFVPVRVLAQTNSPVPAPITTQDEQYKTVVGVADSIARTTNDAWRIAEGQWRSANAFSEGIKSMATAIAAAITITLGFIGLIGFKNVSDLRKDIRDEIKIYQSHIDTQIQQIRDNTEKSHSDLRDTLPTLVAKEVGALFGHNNDMRLAYERHVSSIQNAVEKIDNFMSRYQDDISPFIDAAKGISDPIGDFHALLRDRVLSREVHDPINRHKIRKVLQNFIDNEAIVSVNDLFNATNVASHLNYSDLAERLAELAYDRWPIPIHEARMLRFKVAQGGTKGDDSFGRIMELVASTPVANCELIVADGWNVAEERRDYDALLGALERRRLAPEYAPSFVHAIAALAAIRGGKPNWKSKADEYLTAAKVSISEESPKSTWHAGAIREIHKAEQWMVVPDKNADDNSDYDGVDKEFAERFLGEALAGVLSKIKTSG